MSLPREVLAKYVVPGCVFVETGTRWGDTTIRAMEFGAAAAITMESDELFATLARMHIYDALRERADNVHVLRGQSTAYLGGVLPAGQFDGCPILVFLDAHTETRTPVLDELSCISRWAYRPYAILIDDARLMGTNWKTTVQEVEESLRALFPEVALGREDGTVPGDVIVARTECSSPPERLITNPGVGMPKGEIW